MFGNTKTVMATMLATTLMILNPVLAIADTDFHPTVRDTSMTAPVTTETVINTDGFERVYETASLLFYYDFIHDIIMIIDERGPVPYAWTTGANIPLPDDVRNAVADLSPTEIIEQGFFIENRMNAIFINQANSLLQVELFDDNLTPTVFASSDPNILTSFTPITGEPGCFKFTMNITTADLKIAMRVSFTETGIKFSILYDDIIGEGKNRLGAIIIAQYLGALGGERLYFNEESGAFDYAVRTENRPAYSFVPDGPGALIRFNHHPVSLSPFIGSVFGEDVAQAEFFEADEIDRLQQANVLMPVFGVVHGELYNGFFANVTSGAQYAQIVHLPNGNQVYYDRIFPRFIFNQRYFQVFNQRGEGFFSLFPQPNHFDIAVQYTFLAGDGSNGQHRADWTGMAHVYREFLMVEKGLELSPTSNNTSNDIPLRIDFLMAESQRRPFGRSNVVMTTPADVNEILNTLTATGIENINVGLLGFANGGLTTASVSNPRFVRGIGTERAFRNLIQENAERNIDISFANDFVTINQHRAAMNTATRHISGQFVTTTLAVATNAPVNQTFLARTEESINWLERFVNRHDFTNSISIAGLGNTLYSQHTRNETTISRGDNLQRIVNSFANLSQQTELNLYAPHVYAWPYTSRFLTTPMFPFQYVIQTDTVPFLPMVLNGTMELYAPYVNFSFFSDQDVLRMIDYNVYPLFLFTKQPSYLLLTTNSANLFSTEFDQFHEILIDVYNRINQVLSQVQGATWTHRTVVQNGVIVNHYDNDLMVVINYTNMVINFAGNLVEPLSARVLEVN